MKRLLTYLFIVLGLVLSFSVNADEKEKRYKITVYVKSPEYIIFKFKRAFKNWDNVKVTNSWSYMRKQSFKHCSKFGKGSFMLNNNDRDDRPLTHIKYRFMCGSDPFKAKLNWTRNVKKFQSEISSHINITRYSDSSGITRNFEKRKETQTAKIKPNEMKTIGNSQVEKLSIDNQKLKFCVDDRVNNTYSPYINTSNSECGGYTKKTNFAKYIEWKFRWNFERISDFKKTEKELFQIVKDNLVSETERYGLNKCSFDIIKLRTMHEDSEMFGNTEKSDPRVYSFAKNIRNNEINYFCLYPKMLRDWS